MAKKFPYWNCQGKENGLCSGKNLGKGSLGEKKEIFSFRFGTNASNKQHLARNKKKSGRPVRATVHIINTLFCISMYKGTSINDVRRFFDPPSPQIQFCPISAHAPIL
jgi:hypothetical protein